MSGGAASTRTAEVLLPLPQPQTRGPVSVEEAIARRRSVREFSREPLTDGQLSRLFWAGQSRTGAGGGRAAASAGALYPLDLYVVRAGSVCRYVPQQRALAVLESSGRPWPPPRSTSARSPKRPQ